jgi:adenylate cyclase
MTRPRAPDAHRVLAATAAVLAAWVLAHASGLQVSGVIQRADLWLDDLRLTATAPAGPDARVAIVDIDERSLAEWGRWPWSRATLGTLVDQLFATQRIAALGVDLTFPEPEGDPPDQALARAMAGRPVVLGVYLTADRGGSRQGELPAALGAPPPGAIGPGPAWNGHGGNIGPLARAAAGAGVINAYPDDDGVVRRVPLVATAQARVVPSLALALWLRGPGAAAQPAWTAGDAPALAGLRLADAARRAGRWQPLDADGAVRVPFSPGGGPGASRFTYVSATDVLAQRLPPGALAGRQVLIGSSAPGLSDLRATPFHPALPGVEVHAQVLAGLLDGRLAAVPSWSGAWQVLASAAMLALTGLLGRRRSPAVAAAGFAGGAAALAGVAAWALAAHDLVLPLAAPLLAGGGMTAAAAAAAWLHVRQERAALARLFGRYVPEPVARALARDPSRQPMQADNRELTILFCDLRGFSALAEQLAPQPLRALVNLYFSRMTAAVHAQGGTVDKFIGDAVMAFWGAPLDDPQHARHAVQGALAMAQACGPLNADLAAQGLPAVAVGLGLSTGVVCVGDLGSEQRRSYTAVGDAVNLAARIEALTRRYGLDLLVGDTTARACGDLPGWQWVEVDHVQVRGRQAAVTVFTLVQRASPTQGPSDDPVRLWHLARAAHAAHDAALCDRLRGQLQARPDLPERLRLLLPLLDTPPAAPTSPPA